MIELLAQISFGGMSLVQLAIYIIVAAGLVALVVIGLKALGVTLPQWFINVCLVVLVVVVLIIAVKLIGGLI